MMNRATPPDHVLNCYTDMTVLERQRARLKSQLDPFLDHCPSSGRADFTGLFSSGGFFSDPPLINDFLGTGGSVEPDLFLENGWPDLRSAVGLSCSGYGNGSGSGFGCGSGHQVNYGVTPVQTKAKDSVSSKKISATTYRSESFKKRKLDKVTHTKVMGTLMEEGPKEKKIKGWEEEGEENSKITEQNTGISITTKNSKSITKNNKNKKDNSSNDSSKDNSKVTEVHKPDYIHVRARRGQATDSHSLAERVRREKISERMKYLQDLVPGCNKITGKAGMLDEIINYVQSLQRQVEFLSMKLAAVNPRLDFNIDDVFPKEVFSPPTSNFQNILMPSNSEITSSGYLHQFDPMQQVVSCSGTETGINPNSDMVVTARRTTGCPISMPDTFLDSSCFNNVQASSMWDSDLQSLYSNLTFEQGRSQLTALPSQPFSVSVSTTSNLKMEM